MYVNPIKGSSVHFLDKSFTSKVKNTDKANQSINYPPPVVLGLCVKHSDIVKFHSDIAKRSDRDKLSYNFYTTPMDFGSGMSNLELPSMAPFNSAETLFEIKKEFDRLISKESTLSSKEKEFITYLDQKVYRRLADISRHEHNCITGSVYDFPKKAEFHKKAESLSYPKIWYN